VIIRFRNSSQGNTQNFLLILTTMSTYSQAGSFIFQNSNVLVVSRFLWLIGLKGKAHKTLLLLLLLLLYLLTEIGLSPGGSTQLHTNNT
jgi:hypothetical protein